jgi:hypothetical protein
MLGLSVQVKKCVESNEDKLFLRNKFTKSRNINMIASEIPDVTGILRASSYCRECTA